MPGLRCFIHCLLAFPFYFFSLAGDLSAGVSISLTDSIVVQGGIIRIGVSSTTPPDTVTGSFIKRALPFIRAGDGSFYSLAAVDLATKPGVYPLVVRLRGTVDEDKVQRLEVRVRDANFPVQELTLEPAKVFPDSAAQARIGRESALRNRKWAQWSPIVFWNGPFIRPLEGEMSRFGSRRVINGAPRSPHSGVDISAPSGTPVAAPAGGKVILTGDFFFSGKSVYIDHGLGLIGMFFHLSRIDVEEGELIEKGQTIGAVGSTGRATGPHLHWGVRWRNARVNPASLLNLEFPL